MGLLTFGINITLDGCIDHREGLADDELHRYWTALMDGERRCSGAESRTR
jgi:hypothetical protein